MSPCHGGQIDSLFLKELGSLHSRFLVCTAAYRMCRHLLPSALPHVTGLIIYWYCCDYWSLWSLTKEFNVFCQHPGNCGKLICWLANRVKVETVADLIFLGSKITADGDCSHEIKDAAPWNKSYDKPRQNTKKQRYHFTDKGPYSQSYGFSGSHVWMWE